MRRMYSENQLVKVLEDKDIVAKTLKQTQTNYSLDISSLEVINLTEGIEHEFIYGRLEEINNVLYIVWFGKFTNTTEENKTFTNCDIVVHLDSEIAKRIIDSDGKSVHELSTGRISADMAFKGDSVYPASLNRFTGVVSIQNKSSENDMYISPFIGGQTITAGQTQLFCFRTFLTLL